MSEQIKINEIEKYRFDCGKLFEYREESNAYIFVCNSNGKTEKQTIRDWEYFKLTNDEF